MSLQDNLTNAIHQGLWAYTRGKNYRQQQYNEQQEFEVDRALNRYKNFSKLYKPGTSVKDVNLEHLEESNEAINTAKDAAMNLPAGTKLKNYEGKLISNTEFYKDWDTRQGYVKTALEEKANDALPKGIIEEQLKNARPVKPVGPTPVNEEALGRAPEAIYARDMVNQMKQPGLPQLAYDPTAGLQREDLIPAHPNGQKLLDWNGVPSGKSIEEFANTGISSQIQQAANTQAQATIQQHEIQKQAMKEHMAVLEGKMRPTFQEEQRQEQDEIARLKAKMAEIEAASQNKQLEQNPIGVYEDEFYDQEYDQDEEIISNEVQEQPVNTKKKQFRSMTDEEKDEWFNSLSTIEQQKLLYSYDDKHQKFLDNFDKKWPGLNRELADIYLEHVSNSAPGESWGIDMSSFEDYAIGLIDSKKTWNALKKDVSDYFNKVYNVEVSSWPHWRDRRVSRENLNEFEFKQKQKALNKISNEKDNERIKALQKQARDRLKEEEKNEKNKDISGFKF